MDNSAEKNVPTNGKRKTALMTIGGVVTIVGLVYGVYWIINNGKHETTDNAYVSGNIVQITPQIAGTVAAINAQDTDFVRKSKPRMGV